MKKPDWKKFSELRKVVLERFCRRVFEGIHEIESDSEASFHERYLSLYQYIHDSNKTMSLIFDGTTKMLATTQLRAMANYELLEDGELEGFSDEVLRAIGRDRES
ncbi:hypothetical protein S7S_03355 [Isoalcanivorax pacificus W11-5]|uniref:Uncharacterized protein n=1 Tax=Isoalcanivorax pacificus W11-5 TaxID=391936 RepID=A0A0B4XKM7_9GAMM|nr:hypothetical protein [Isoalcanivorax pacificus]AJD47093.1 hypothetical protein S7S_03355 [Isoalcanivorax pacificus W11-5]